MIKLYSAAAMRAADNYAIHQLGIPSLQLMDTAADFVAEAALGLMEGSSRAAVFCGSGNNGGDGIGAAVHLLNLGMDVRVFLTGRREKMTDDTAAMELRLQQAGGRLEDFDPACADILDYVNTCGVIIDAMFGIGLNAPLRASAAQAVACINASPVPVVAADIPSGIAADTGCVLGSAVRADVTVTFTAPKPGHYTEPGCLYCGRLLVRQIGIPRDALDAAGSTDVFAFTDADAALPRRRPDAHKGDFGRCLIAAGSVGYTGAPVLAARACVRSGAGLVFLGVPQEIYAIAAVKSDEAMPFPLPSTDGRLTEDAVPELLNRLETADVCLAGPGLGRSAGVSAAVRALLRSCRCPLVLDADGINAIAGHIDLLDEATCPVILTPHPGEFARLAPELAGQSRLSAAGAFAAAHHCTVVLKGHRTVTAFPDGTVYLNTTGNPGMAKGGSGDVLAGMIAGFLAQKLPLETAVPAAVCLHGKAGDLCAAAYGEYAMTPSDMICMLAEVLKNAAG